MKNTENGSRLLCKEPGLDKSRDPRQATTTKVATPAWLVVTVGKDGPGTIPGTQFELDRP